MVLTSSLSYSSASVCTTIVAVDDGDDTIDADDDGDEVEDIPSSTKLLPLPARVIAPIVGCCRIPSAEDWVKKSIVMAAFVDPSPLPNNVGISGSHCLRASNIFSENARS